MNAISTPTATIAPRRVSIADGRRVTIRPIERSDASGLSDFYAGLSRESRHRRFLGDAPPSERLVAAFCQPDGEGLVAILEEVGPNDGAVVAHASLQPDGSGGAEVALAVADELQGRGLGRALMTAALELARESGLRRVTASLLADNVRMRRLLRGAGCDVVADELDAGVEEISLGLQAAA